MQRYRAEADRLSEAVSLVASRFPLFGVNKRREIARLLHEISGRDRVSPAEALRRSGRRDFKGLKEDLLRLRFPSATPEERGRAFLPELSLDPAACIAAERAEFSPGRILVEAAARGSALASAFSAAYPEAATCEIPSLREYVREAGGFGAADYNRRRDTVFIVRERRDFFKPCPCTRGALPCGYHIMNLGFGCIYECAYCFLQEYANAPGIVLPANTGDFFDAFPRYAASPRAKAWQRGGRMRLGTGEFSDSLALDHLTGYSTELIEFFAAHPEALFEFKTKSDNVGALLSARHAGNIVVSWSLNPQRIIDAYELYTASLAARIRAAEKCAAAGYLLGFHFDPVLIYRGWERDYGGVVAALFEKIAPERIAWVSIGSFRLSPGLKRVIENRFPASGLLDADLIPGYDSKLRYTRRTRSGLYAAMLQMLRRHAKAPPIYLCMEESGMWREAGLAFPFTG